MPRMSNKIAETLNANAAAALRAMADAVEAGGADRIEIDKRDTWRSGFDRVSDTPEKTVWTVQIEVLGGAR